MTQNNGVVFMFNVYVSFVKFKYKAKYLRERHARHIKHRERASESESGKKSPKYVFIFYHSHTHIYTFSHFIHANEIPKCFIAFIAFLCSFCSFFSMKNAKLY